MAQFNTTAPTTQACLITPDTHPHSPPYLPATTTTSTPLLKLFLTFAMYITVLPSNLFFHIQLNSSFREGSLTLNPTYLFLYIITQHCLGATHWKVVGVGCLLSIRQKAQAEFNQLCFQAEGSVQEAMDMGKWTYVQNGRW